MYKVLRGEDGFDIPFMLRYNKVSGNMGIVRAAPKDDAPPIPAGLQPERTAGSNTIQ